MDEMITVPETAAGPGLLLRAWTERDIPALLAAHEDPVMRRWSRNPITSAAHARDVIARYDAAWRAGTSFFFAIQVLDADGGASDPVGSVSVRGLGADSGRGDVGYWTAAPARGRGVATRALNAVATWAFQLPASRPLDGLELIHTVGNLASCRVAAKTGFAFASVLPPLPPEFPDDGHLHIRSRT